MRTMKLIALALACFSSVASAANQTPSAKLGFAFEPYMFGIGFGRGAFVVSCTDQGSVVTERDEPEGDSNNTAGVSEWITGLAAGNGTLLIISHGSTSGCAVEAYTTAALRDAAWTSLQNGGYTMSELYKASSDDGYHISMYASGISAHFTAANTIVHNMSCYGHSYQSYWTNARVRLGYSYSCPANQGRDDLVAIWPRLAGSDRNYRSLGDAISGTAIEVDGDCATTLTPFVTDVSIDYGAQIPGNGKDVSVEFDTATNQASGALGVTGPFTISNIGWDNDHKVHGRVTPTGDGDGYFTAYGTAIASANCADLYLDGGNDWDVRIRHGDNPAATIQGVSFSNDRVSWEAESLFKTDHLRVEATADVMGQWTTAIDKIPATIGHASVAVNAAGPLLRLVEVETDGTELIHGIASREDTRLTLAPEPELTIEQKQQAIADLNAQRQGSGYGGQLPMSSSTLTIYTTPALEDAVWGALGYYWMGWFGIDVEVVLTTAFPQNPDGIRNGIKNDIRTRYLAGERAFLLVGDANDHVQFTGVEYPNLWLPQNGWETIRQAYLADGYQNQSAHDLIPTWYTPDTLPRDENQGWVTPYWMSDLPYGNIDADANIEALVTRLPFTTADDVYNYGYKLQTYNGGWYGMQTAGFHVGNLDHNGCSGTEALQIAQIVSSLLPPDVYEAWLLESQYPSAAQRNTIAAQMWDSNRYEFLFLASSISNRSWPGNMFDQTNGTNPWRMDMIHPGGTHAAVVVAGACDGGDFPRTEDQDYGLPIGHRFLSAWSKGAIAWVGPTAGTWQDGNLYFALYFSYELFNHPERAMAESYLIAVNTVLALYSDQPEVINTVMSYAFLGDPLVPMNRAMFPVDVSESASPLQLMLGQNTPNPVVGMTSFSFQLPARGKADVSLYDIVGRRIISLMSGEMPQGNYHLTWDGRDQDGRRVANGVYLYRLRTESGSRGRKLTILR